jgi:hypothetical protein
MEQRRQRRSQSCACGTSQCEELAITGHCDVIKHYRRRSKQRVLPLLNSSRLIRVKYFSIRGQLFFRWSECFGVGRARLKASTGFSVLERERIVRWESGKPAFGFPLFHPLRRRGCVECGNRAAISKDCGKRGVLSVSPSFPQASFYSAAASVFAFLACSTR